jgi:hypothetical protein
MVRNSARPTKLFFDLMKEEVKLINSGLKRLSDNGLLTLDCAAGEDVVRGNDFRPDGDVSKLAGAHAGQLLP